MPRYGFNVQWLFTQSRPPQGPDERVLDAVAAWGFDFLRLPTDYRHWAVGGDPFRADEAVLQLVDQALEACRQRGIHLSLNLHRAPGYVITGWETEPYDLWSDQEPQDAFVATWERFAERYRGVPGEALSFDLVNEPPALGLRGFSRDAHERVIRRTHAAVRAVDPQRPVVIDGLDGGNLAMPELADLAGTTQSVRGYQPMAVSHYRAEWWPPSAELPAPAYPVEYDGRHWDRAGLRASYAPWRQLEQRGVPVHVGEFGCYEHTPDDVARAWFADLFAVFAEFGWGYALWEFEGPFGVVGHHRPGAAFEQRDGFLVDVGLLELLQSSRVRDAVTG
ncbi:aryl-phospho-beta-D-glucosidase BglC (GH1 family) [Motilibacter rhizosphaerae]|uniref:Aryl-phospho-beta-D-glucosidase BglC (GH1 family) n=1 Tax=Motilibacter rhizosphaerae TaxID=598652 RepID=A0A4Q7NW02_9ACTN|nr:cellulase family glycosylhydrolase [Motilibacter rhizosphaerae]RZS91463.1 aryl-phospho-beta-D-glucosidase BglC (GH1 family) [Motilibacter rhizosphaerae]